jgi:hypothetical protein
MHSDEPVSTAPIPSHATLQEIQAIQQRLGTARELPGDAERVVELCHLYKNHDLHNLLFAGLVEARARLRLRLAPVPVRVAASAPEAA